MLSGRGKYINRETVSLFYFFAKKTKKPNFVNSQLVVVRLQHPS